MSAYLCSDLHFSALAHAGELYAVLGKDSPEVMAQRLKLENALSMLARYPGNDDGGFEPCAYSPRSNALSPLQILSACHCCAYQSCEHAGWKDSAACAFLERLRATVCERHGIDSAIVEIGPYRGSPRYTMLPEYESAGGEITRDEAPPVVVPPLGDLLSKSPEEQARILESLPIDAREILIVEIARITTPPAKGKISVRDIASKGGVRYGRAYAGSVSKGANAEINPGESITLWGRREGRSGKAMPYLRTFRIGDVVEVGSYNLTYTGKILSIGPKTITVSNSGRTERHSLYDFDRRNWDLDLDAIAKSNNAWMD